MQGSKLIKLLKCLTPDAIRRLKKVLVSPFFTSNEHLLDLYTYLKKYYPDFNHSRLDKEIVFAQVFPKHKYSDIKLRNLMSELTTLIEDFLVTEALKEKTYLRQKILLDVYKNKEEVLYLKTLNKLTDQLNRRVFRDAEYFSEAFQLTLMYTEWNAEHSQIEAAFFYQKEAELLLNQYYRMLQAQFQLSRKARQALSEKITGEKPKVLFDKPALESNVLYQLYQMSDSFLEGGGTAKIAMLLKSLKEARGLVKPSDHRELFVALLNFCIGQMQVREGAFLPLVFDLYQFGLSEEILLENQRISATTFLNIVIAGGRMGSSEWTENFLEKYTAYLSEEERSDVLALGKAYLFFYEKKFSESLQTLTQHIFKNPIQWYPARTFMLRCCLELYLLDTSYLDTLLAQCAAFEKYVRRNDFLSGKQKNAALAFEKMILKMVKGGRNQRLDKATKEDLIKKLANTPQIESRKWLLEKLQRS